MKKPGIKNYKSEMLLAVCCAAFLFAAAGCAKKQADTIRSGFLERPNTLNPVLPMNKTAQLVSDLVFDGLFNFSVNDKNEEVIIPALAEKIIQYDNKTTYRAVLRDARWHDNRKVTADDILFSYRAYINQDNKADNGLYLANNIKDIRILKDNEAEIEFRMAVSAEDAERILTFKIIPSRYKSVLLNPSMTFSQSERDFTRMPIGTGPFMFDKETRRQSLVLTASLNYFQTGKPACSSFEIVSYDDPDIMIKDLLKGNLNIVSNLSPTDYLVIETAKQKGKTKREVEYADYMPFSYYAVALNTSSPSLSDVNTRNVIAQAVSRSSLYPGLTDDKETVMINEGPFPANIIDLNFKNNTRGYKLPVMNDVFAKNARGDAKQTVLPKKLQLVYQQEMGSLGETVCRNIAAQLASKGITVSVESRPVNPFKNLVYRDKQYEMALVYSDGFDRTFAGIDKIYSSAGVSNITGTADAQLDEMLFDWNMTRSLLPWIRKTQALHEKIMLDSPYIYLFSIEKRCYYTGLGDVAVASDRLFAAAPQWYVKKK